MNNNYEWWYLKNGTIDNEYSGMAVDDNNVWWVVENGKVDKSFTGLMENPYGWWYIKNGTVDFSYNGMAKNEYGWWAIKNGAVDFNYSGLMQNNDDWWYLKNGTIDYSYNGIASNDLGNWVVKNGAVDFTYNGTYKFNNNTYDVTNGHAVARGLLKYSDQYKNWCYFVGDDIDWTYTGVAKNEKGELYYATKGVIDWYFYGIAYDKDLGYLLFSKDHYDNGKNWFNKNYVGTIIYNGITYDVNEGHATVAKVNLNSTYKNRPVYVGKYLRKGEYYGDNGWSFIEAEDGMVYYFLDGRYYCDDRDNSGKFVFRW